MAKYSHYQTRVTSQSQPIPGRDKEMAENNAGGFAFTIDDWKRLDRFLILGAEANTYYVGKKELTIRNAQAVHRCINEDGVRVVNRIVEISEAGRAPKNEPALFTLAMCAGLGNSLTRKTALEALPRVARIGTHLFHFAEYAKGFRGWGRGLREAIARWYTEKDPDKLSYQAVKYQQRDGWSHRDLLRLSHPKATSDRANLLHRWIVGKEVELTLLPALVQGFLLVKDTEDVRMVIKCIQDYGLTREMIPTKWLNERSVWEALLDRMPMTAMIRNLPKMTDVGLIAPLSDASAKVVNELNDKNRIRKARVHPLSILVALKTYEQGHGIKGKLTWEPVTAVVDALDEAFYLAFDNVEPTLKRTLLALDISGSMAWGNIAGMPITPREASAAMAMVTARTEPKHRIAAFSHELVSVTISPRQRLDDVCRQIDQIPMGRTDCALPMVDALRHRFPVDVIVIYTDNETWCGHIHPAQALQEYRRKMGLDTKLVVVGMTSSGFSIADPNDPGMLDLVGFDTAAPNIISAFTKGDI